MKMYKLFGQLILVAWAFLLNGCASTSNIENSSGADYNLKAVIAYSALDRKNLDESIFQKGLSITDLIQNGEITPISIIDTPVLKNQELKQVSSVKKISRLNEACNVRVNNEWKQLRSIHKEPVDLNFRLKIENLDQGRVSGRIEGDVLDQKEYECKYWTDDLSLFKPGLIQKLSSTYNLLIDNNKPIVLSSFKLNSKEVYVVLLVQIDALNNHSKD